MKEALLGFNKTITHLDGEIINVTRDEVTQPGFIIKISNKGMPIHERSGEFGNLFVKINVNFPVSLTEVQRLKAENLFNRRSSW